MVKGPLALAALVLTLLATRSLFQAVAALAAAFTLMIAFDAWRALRLMRRRPKPAIVSLLRSFRPAALRKERKTLYAISRTSLPLGLANTIGSLSILVPRYAVDHYLGAYDLGIYGAIAYWQQAGSVAVGAIGQAAIPRLAHLFERGLIGRFLRILLAMLLLGAGLGAAGWIVAALYGKTVLTILYRPEYASSVDIFRWQMISSGAAFIAAFAQIGLTSMRSFTIQLPMFTVVTAVSCGVSYLLIPRIGLVGAPVATLCAMTAQALLALIILAWRLRGQRAGVPASGL
jgi:O-antigen/teichoic acid export membrane protein